MENLVCGIVMVPLAYVAYTQSKKRKLAGKSKEAAVWRIVSAIAGAVAMIIILDACFAYT